MKLHNNSQQYTIVFQMEPDNISHANSLESFKDLLYINR